VWSVSKAAHPAGGHVMTWWIGLSREQLQRTLSARYDLSRLERDRQINDHVRRHGVERIPLVIDTRDVGSFFVKRGGT
jgi:hypothetical protein